MLTNTKYQSDRIQVSFRIDRDWHRQICVVLAQSGKSFQEIAIAGLRKEVALERKRLAEERQRRKQALEEESTNMRRQTHLPKRKVITGKGIAAC